MTRKLLVICNLVHASPRIPGLLGPLSKDEWEITLITRKLPAHYDEVLGFPPEFAGKIQILEVGKVGDSLSKYRRMLTLLGFSNSRSFLEQAREISDNDRVRGLASGIFKIYMTLFAFPDLEKNWIRKACKVARKLDDKKQFDYILSSSPFPSVHIAASRITKHSTGSWIADFRDPWVSNPVYGYGPIRRFFEKKLEIKTLLTSKVIITVSEKYAEILRAIHNKPTFVIPNGYTIQPDSRPHGLELNNRPRIFSHTGNIYRDFHDINLLLKAVSDLKRDGILNAKNFKLNFYGRYESDIATLVNDLEVNDLVLQIGYVSRRESVEIQRRSDCLIFFNWDAKNGGGLSHLKFYEYLASGTPILSIGGEATPYTEIIEMERVGLCGFEINSVKAAIKNILNSNLREDLELVTNDPRLYKYSYNHQSFVLENILRTI